jgi:hypothetical protein
MLDHESSPRHHCSRPGDPNKGRHWQVKDEQMEQGMKSRQVTAMTQTQQASVSVGPPCDTRVEVFVMREKNLRLRQKIAFLRQSNVQNP